MARIILRRTSIEPTKISGPYSLLAVMLLVVEVIFTIWFWKAESSLERSVAGSIMAAVFVTLMLTVLKMNQTPARRKKGR